MQKRGEIHLAFTLSTMLCIAQQNLSIGVNVVSRGSPSRIFKVLLISLGITILPKSSTLLTMPVAFIYLSPFPVGVDAHIDPRAVIALLRCPVCALATVRLRCTQTAATRSGRCIRPRRRSQRSPTIILQITLLVSVNKRRLYRRIYFLLSP